MITPQRRHDMRRSQAGATLAELLYVMPLFFVLLFGLFEMAYAYRTRATLNVATFQAARAGAVNHAVLDPMRESLARGMIPLYMRGDTDAARYAAAYTSSRTLVAALRRLPWAPEAVTIVSPTRAVFERFREQRRLRLPWEQRATTRMVIPNDNLRWRNPGPRPVRIGGETRRINIHDANLLKIATYWCHPLRTPVLGRLINATVSGVFGIGKASPEQRACNAVGQATGNHYLAITSQAVVRMQSDVVYLEKNLR